MRKIENNCYAGGLDRDCFQVQVYACVFLDLLSKVHLGVCRCNRVDNCMYQFVLQNLILGCMILGLRVRV